jgi:hypothetical protein
MVHTTAEVALRNSNDDKEVETLLIGTHSLGHVRSLASTGPPEQRGNWVDRSMSSGNRPI